MKNTIGTRIAELRKASGEKQEELAEVLGCNRGSLANYETGKRTPDIETIIKIAQHYETTTDYILGVTNNKTVDTTVQAISDYTGLSDQAIEILRLFKEIKKVWRKMHDVCKENDKHDPVYSFDGYFDGYNFYELSHNQTVYEIDFLDWYLRKMNFCFPVLAKITHMVNVNHFINTGSRFDAHESDIMDIIDKMSPAVANLIETTGTIITGIEYREFLLNKCKDEFGLALHDFSTEYSPFEEPQEDERFLDVLCGENFDLKTRLNKDIELLQHLMDFEKEQKKDGDT